MIAVIVDNHAHRLLNSGVVESARIRFGGEGTVSGRDMIVDKIWSGGEMENNWKILNPELDLGITGSDMHVIKKQLEYLHAIFPEGRTGLPITGAQAEVAADPNAPRQ